MFFGIGIIKGCFQPTGMWPPWRERLNRVVTDSPILLAVDLSVRGEIPSGSISEDLDVFRDGNK